MATLYGLDDTVQRKKPLLPGEPVDDEPQASTDPVRVPVVGSFDEPAKVDAPSGGDASPFSTGINDANPWATTQPATIPPVSQPVGGDMGFQQPTQPVTQPVRGDMGTQAPISDPTIQTPVPVPTTTTSPLLGASSAASATDLHAPAQYVPGTPYDTPFGQVTWDGQGHPSINGAMVDYNGQPIVTPSVSQEAWLAQMDPNSYYNAPGTVVQSEAKIPGGTADMIGSYEGLAKMSPQFAQWAQSNPNATIGDAVRAGVLTKQQYIDAGYGFQTGYDDDWMNRKVGELSPSNIQFNGGTPDVSIRNPVTPAPMGDVTAQAANPGTGTGPAGQRSVPVVGGGDASTGVPSLPPRVGSGFDPSTIPAVNNAPTVSASGVPVVGGPLSSINPDNDLRSKQINPVSSDKTGTLSDLAMGAAQKVGNGASRADISKQYLDAFDESAQPKIRDQIRNVWQDAASKGRIGMGDVSVDALRPVTDYATQRSAYAKQLAADSAEGDINDRLNNLSALDNAQGQSYGQDLTGRNELRSERDYQTAAERNAINDAVQQWLLEQQAEQQDFSRGNTLAATGYANSPSNLLFGAGQSYGNAAGLDFQALAQFLSQMMGR